jgi:AcrR family transcriptional regulator
VSRAQRPPMCARQYPKATWPTHAVFGSKEELFREAIAHYEAREGGFADRALMEPTARGAIERLLRDAIETYTRPGKPQGCMVVSSATNCSNANDAVTAWLAEHRRARTASIIDRLRRAISTGELPANTDVETLGDCFAALLHGRCPSRHEMASPREGARRVGAFLLMCVFWHGKAMTSDSHNSVARCGRKQDRGG